MDILRFFISVIFLVGIIFFHDVYDLLHFLFKKKKALLFHPKKAVQIKEPEKWEFPEDLSVKRNIRHQLVERLEFHVNAQKTALGLKLMCGSFSSYQEYCDEFDKLTEWKKQEWRKIYEDKF